MPSIRRSIRYLLIAVAATAIAAVIIRPWSASGGIFTAGGDFWWVQASAEAAGQAGPFGIDPHLAWPNGYSVWSVPQFGVFLAVCLWFLAGLVGLSSASTVLWAVAISAGLNSAACLYFFRSLSFRGPRSSKWTSADEGIEAPIGQADPGQVVSGESTRIGEPLALAFAIALGASPAVLFMPGHLNVGAWFLVPLILGLIVRIDLWRSTGSPRRAIATVTCCGLVGLLSPMWWLVVALLLVSVMAIPPLIFRQWRSFGWRVALIAGLLAGFVVQLILTLRVPNANEANTRGPWDSNTFGGHLSDFLLASPLFDRLVPRMAELLGGASREFKPLGIIAGIAGLVAVLVVLLGTAIARRTTLVRERQRDTVSQLTIVTLLFFLVGGLGNLQAAAAVVVGTASPARAWSRLGLVLALMGCLWLGVFIEAWLRRRHRWLAAGSTGQASQKPVSNDFLVLSVAALVFLVWFIDTSATRLITFTTMGTATQTAPPQQFAEFGAIDYIVTNREPCPILQLPATDGLLVRTPAELKDLTRFYYRSYLPYLIAPTYFWSYGSVNADDLARVDDLAAQVQREGSAALAAADVPYCAVLFDREAAMNLDRKRRPLPGSDVTRLGAPGFSNDRFDVFLLPDK